MNIFTTEKLHAHLEVAKTLYRIANNCHKLVEELTKKISHKNAIGNHCAGMGHIDIAALNPVEKAVESISLIILPDTLVSQPWIIASNIRQFRENVEFAFNGHPNLTPQQFTHFVQIMNEITNSLGQTCKDIKEVVDKIQDTFNKNQANSK